MTSGFPGATQDTDKTAVVHPHPVDCTIDVQNFL